MHSSRNNSVSVELTDSNKKESIASGQPEQLAALAESRNDLVVDTSAATCVNHAGVPGNSLTVDPAESAVGTSNPIITVVRDPEHTLGKQFPVNADGTVSKKSAVSIAVGVAMMHRVDTHQELAALLNTVGADTNAAIVNASFSGIAVDEEFLIL